MTTNNKLTDERLSALTRVARDSLELYEMELPVIDDVMLALAELQQRRAADKNYFMFGIATPEGDAYLEEFCVSSDRGLMEDEVAALNDAHDTDGYRVVAFYTAIPLVDSERAELEERRKADSSEPVLYAMRGVNLDTDAVSTSKRVVDGWVDEWNQERKPGVPEYQTVPLFAAPQPAPVVPDEKRDDDGSVTSDFDQGWNACRAAILAAAPKQETD